MNTIRALILILAFTLVGCEYNDGVEWQAQQDAQALVDNLDAAGFIALYDKENVRRMLEAKFEEVILRERTGQETRK